MSKQIHICQYTRPRKNNVIMGCDLNNYKQIDCLGQLYLSKSNDKIVEKIKRSIEIKINGYKQQDIKKQRDITNLITYEESIIKLLTSKLICYYCDGYMTLTYSDVRQPDQWTFDRIDNDKCHSNNNVVVCCFKCNMKRGVSNSDDFKFSTNLKIVKIKR